MKEEMGSYPHFLISQRTTFLTKIQIFTLDNNGSLLFYFVMDLTLGRMFEAQS